jgi:serine/threonine-protein kinase
LKACASCSRCLDDDLTACPDDGGTTLPEVLPGSRLIDGTYELERRLGEGGMGVVFGVRHVSLDRRFAVKLIRSASAPAPEFHRPLQE